MHTSRQITLALCLLFALIGLSACIDLEPDTATNPVGTSHTVTANVIFDTGEPVSNVLINFRVIMGPNEGLTSQPGTGECNPDNCRTNVFGQVSWTYSSSQPGIDFILADTAILVDDEDPVIIDSDVVEKIWVADVPAISQWGVIALASVLGIIAFMALGKSRAET